MHSDFIACRMLPRGHASRQNISLFLKPSAVGLGGEDEDEEGGPVEGDDVLTHVILAQVCGILVYFSTKDSCSYSEKCVIIPETLRASLPS